jgi:hypothetical protein
MAFKPTLAFALVAFAAGSGRKSDHTVLKEIQVDQTLATTRVSPALRPESNKKFFGKDYPRDERPKVDVLHFNHPYPVVQDSEEFYKDFVSDQNADNGEWKAQQEYDRLRHKLRQLKKDAAQALKKKNEEKAELEATMDKFQDDMSKQKAEIAKKSNEMREPIPPAKPVKPEKPVKPSAKDVSKVPERKVEEASSWSWEWPSWPWSWPKAPSTPESPEKVDLPTMIPDEAALLPPRLSTTNAPATPKPFDAGSAAKAVEAAMKNLQECQRQLEEAKMELKKLMGKLDDAKLKQAQAHKKVQEALARQVEAEKHEELLHEQFNKEAADKAAAEAAYTKQQQKVATLHSQLESAAAKVKAKRDAEDKDGGVYPVNEKSNAVTASFTFGVFVLSASGWFLA